MKCFSNFPGAVIAIVLRLIVRLLALAHELLQHYHDGDVNEWKESGPPETN